MVAGHVDSAHNILMHAGIEGGIFAAAALTLLPLVVLLLGIRARRIGGNASLANWALASFIGIYAGAQFTPALYEHLPFLLIATLASMTAPKRDHSPLPEPVPIQRTR
jgi:hypothetical protein